MFGNTFGKFSGCAFVAIVAVASAHSQAWWGTYNAGVCSRVASAVVFDSSGNSYFTYWAPSNTGVLEKYSRTGTKLWAVALPLAPGYTQVFPSPAVAVNQNDEPVVVYTVVNAFGTIAKLGAARFSPSGSVLNASFSHPSGGGNNALINSNGLLVGDDGYGYCLCFAYWNSGSFYYNKVFAARINLITSSISFTEVGVEANYVGSRLVGNLSKGGNGHIIGAFWADDANGLYGAACDLTTGAILLRKPDVCLNFASVTSAGSLYACGHYDHNLLVTSVYGELNEKMFIRANGLERDYAEELGYNTGRTISILPDGKIIVGGNLARHTGSTFWGEATLLRFDSNLTYMNQRRLVAPAPSMQSFSSLIRTPLDELVAIGSWDSQQTGNAQYTQIGSPLDLSPYYWWWWLSDGGRTEGMTVIEHPGTGATVSSVNFFGGNHTTVFHTSRPPILSSDDYSIPRNTQLVVSAPGLLANDQYSADAALTVTSQPRYGALQVSSNGSFTYTPSAGFFGVDTFSYKLSRDGQDSNAAIVAIFVTGVDTWDLTRDWSDSSNPAGQWSYRAGTNLLPHVQSWLNGFGQYSLPQPAWAPGESSGVLPAWMKSLGNELFSHDFVRTDIVTHSNDPGNQGMPGLSTISWTAPSQMWIKVSGCTWNGRDIGRSNIWRILKNGSILTSGAISSGDGHDRTHPFSFAAGSGGSTAIAKILVNAGDKINLEVERTSTYGDFVGVQFAVEKLKFPFSIGG